MARGDLTVRVDAEISGYERNMRRARNATERYEHQLAVAQERANKMNAAFDAQNAKVSKASQALALAGRGVALFGASAVGVFGAAASKSAQFEKAMSAVEAATGATGAEMTKLRDAALDASTELGRSATEAAAGIEALAKAGVSTADIIGGGLAGAMDLAAAGAIDVGSAAETAATAMTQFRLSGEDVPHVADLLAAAAGKAQGDVSDLSLALKQGGLVASQMGLSLEETTGTLAAFASAGLIGSDAGTSLRTMLLRLANPSKEAADVMAELGINAYDAGGNFVGMAGLAEQLRTRLHGMSQAQRDAALATIFGSDAIRAANVLYKQGAQGIEDWTAKVDDSGFAAEQAAKRMDNLSGDFDKLGAAMNRFFVETGDGAQGPLRKLVQGLTAATNAISKQNEEFARSQGVEGHTDLISFLAAKYDQYNDALNRWLGITEDVPARNEDMAETHTMVFDAIRVQNTETDRLTGLAEMYGVQASGITDANLLAAESFREMVTETQNAATGLLGLRDASRDYEAAVDAAAEAVKENGKTLDIHTEQGRANQAALDNIAAAGWRVIEQQIQQGASEETLQATMANSRAAFIKTATQMGLSRAAAEKLADQLGLIPEAVSTKVSTPGMDEAIQKAGTLRSVILGIPGRKTVYIDTFNRVFTNTGGGKQVVGGRTNLGLFGGATGGLMTPHGFVQGFAGGGSVQRFPHGGSVFGPGTSTSDSIRAMLSNGEFVLRASAVRSIGVDVLNHMNATGSVGGGLSDADRALLTAVANRPVEANFYVDGKLMARSVNRANEQLARQG